MRDLKFGLICLGSKSSLMLLEEAKKFFKIVDLIDIRRIEINITNETTQVLYNGKPLGDYDCLYMKGSHKYATLLYGLTEIYKNKCFVPIDSTAHTIAHNKFMTHLLLSQNKDLKMPRTYYAAKISESKEFLKTLNYPIILKFPSGTHGKGVIFAESSASAISMIDALDIFKQPVLIQDHIDVKSDIRVIVAGDKVISSMRRFAKSGEVRANAHQGGSAESFIVTPQIREMCIQSAKLIGAQVCAMDLIESEYGPLILEANTSPGLQKITEVTKKNIARLIIEYLHEETSKRVNSREKVVSRDVLQEAGIQEIGNREFETSLKVVNSKIVLPEFVYKMGNFNKGESIRIVVEKDKIEVVKG